MTRDDVPVCSTPQNAELWVTVTVLFTAAAVGFVVGLTTGRAAARALP